MLLHPRDSHIRKAAEHEQKDNRQYNKVELQKKEPNLA